MHYSDFFPEARMQKALTSAMLHGEIGSRCYGAYNRRMFFLFFSFGMSINIEFEKKQAPLCRKISCRKMNS